ncbi:hypothetical protein PhCBS80983_g05851 [Powellomyces hirtus]|uniref:Uncharacterized protein n=1 Tax=Powellomyces hirtus TaxID=109895 RepID=A0A507DST9_9FUNG|nr:hypothetical protein PhCBS80983_g05851 [Powellomyces hirtus]
MVSTLDSAFCCRHVGVYQSCCGSACRTDQGNP